MKKRILSAILATVLLLCTIPMAQVSAKEPIITATETKPLQMADNSQLTCSGFISTVSHRNYIDMMMKYYINSSTALQNALAGGQAVLFIFEGGSDNYPSNGYSSSGSNVRNQAATIVVKQTNGVNKIVWCSENSSTLPSQPQNTTGGAENGQTTLMDGIYKIYTANHQQKYGALNVRDLNGNGRFYAYYTPSSNKDGLKNYASGINIHTRSTNTAGSGSGAWSAGCQLIGTGNTSTNIFNSFMQCIANIDYNVWINYSNKQFNFVTAGKQVGYYVVDRQLAVSGLTTMYTTTAINNITEYSRKAKAAATAEASTPVYTNYTCLANIKINTASNIRNIPSATDAGSYIIEYANANDTYLAIGITKNSAGYYWYKVRCKNGNDGYVTAANTTFIEAVSDLTLKGLSKPVKIWQGDVFIVNGSITTKYLYITHAGVYIAEGTTVKTGTPFASVKGTSYNLNALDNSVEFNILAPGTYKYIVQAKAVCYYATSDTNMTSTVVNKVVNNSDFQVVSRKKGDITGEGTLSAADYISIRRQILGQITFDSFESTNADMDGNGVINALDYVRLRTAILTSN